MHGDEQRWVDEAIQTNWVSTVGANINEVERQIAAKVERKYAVALSAGTAALNLAIKLCGEKLYGQPAAGHGALEGKRVFASDMTFGATVNPICYEGGIPVFRYLSMQNMTLGTWIRRAFSVLLSYIQRLSSLLSHIFMVRREKLRKSERLLMPTAR